MLQEFYVTVTRKVEIPLAAWQALEWIEQFEAFSCPAIASGLVKIAIELSERYQISYWDGAVIAAAEALGAETLYSEDLNHEQRYDTVQVLDPFRMPQLAQLGFHCKISIFGKVTLSVSTRSQTIDRGSWKDYPWNWRKTHATRRSSGTRDGPLNPELFELQSRRKAP